MLSRISISLLGAGLAIFAGSILLGKTCYPRWFVLLTPAVTYFLVFLWQRIPQPFRVVLAGGWYNLIFVLYFGASLWMVVVEGCW